jgi:hypothetical protein
MLGLRRVLVVMAIVGGLAVPALARGGDNQSIEKTFSPGQKVWMDLSAGDYRVEAGRDDRIVVRWSTHPGEESLAHVNVTTRGSEASIAANGPKGHFTVTIELPATTSVTIRLTAGDLKMRGITGSKDIHQWAGDIDLEVGQPDAYGSVDASVTAGSLDAPAFRKTAEGLFRSISWRGPGKYTIKVSLTAGDLKLR